MTSRPASFLCLLALLIYGGVHAAPPRPALPPAKAAAARQAAELDQQAAALDAAARYAEAFAAGKQALEARKKLFGERHLDTAASYYTLAGIQEDQGELARAESSYQHALTIREDLLGREHPDTAQVLNAMGSVLLQSGQLNRAEAAWRRALAIREKTAGPDSIEAAKPLNNLAAVRQMQGDARDAVEYSERALAIFEKRLPPDDLMTANTLNNLGIIYADMLGELTVAEGYYQRALASRQKHFGPDHPLVLTSLGNFASFLMSKEDYPGATARYENVLAAFEKSKGTSHPDTIRVRDNLAICLKHVGRLKEAEALGREAVRITEAALGPDNPLLADSLMNLSNVYRKLNQPAEAEPLAARAEAICRRALGAEHPDTGNAMAAHAGALLDLGRRDEATVLAVETTRVRETTLGNILSFTTEAQRMVFQASKITDPCSLLASLGTAEPLEEAVLRTKGAILDSLLEDHLVALASTDPAKRRLVTDACALRRELTNLQLDAPEDPGPGGIKKREIRQRELVAGLRAAESTMAHQVAGVGRARRALGMTVAGVRAALPPGSVLIDFIRYAHDLGHDEATEDRYGAVVLARDLAPRWVALGPAANLDEQMRRYGEAVRGRIADPLALEELLGGLYRTVWKPLEEALPKSVEQVFVSPDGELNLLSFATLLTPDDRFLAERHRITCLASGRDVLPAGDARAADDDATRKDLLVFANPTMSSSQPVPEVKGGAAPVLLADAGPVASSADVRLAYRDLRLGPLPGAEAEANALERFAREQGWKCETLLGAAAREQRLMGVHRPYILHLATHGFFLPPPMAAVPVSKAGGAPAPVGPPPSAQWLNPMRRSGLALAGAGATLEAWAAGLTPNTGDDGIVTAEEVSTLDLHGTWLVVLSACESGNGEVRAGEGVLGLRRGFALAGARHLLLTLWPVGDEEISALILDFYARAQKLGDPARALAETQREHLVRLRRDQGLNAAVRLAGGFILSSAHQ